MSKDSHHDQYEYFIEQYDKTNLDVINNKMKSKPIPIDQLKFYSQYLGLNVYTHLKLPVNVNLLLAIMNNPEKERPLYLRTSNQLTKEEYQTIGKIAYPGAEKDDLLDLGKSIMKRFTATDGKVMILKFGYQSHRDKTCYY